LVVDVLDDPEQIARSERHDAVTGLPLEQFVSTAFAMVHVMRRAAFDLTNEIADEQRRRDGHGEMNMGFDAADGVNEHAAGFDNAILDATMCERFDLSGE